MGITDITEVAKVHGVQEIALPGWSDSEPFVCLAKQPSLYNMAAMGFIPNPLLGAVQTLFTANAKQIEKVSLEKQAQAMIQMARYALVKPSYDEVVEAGLALTDEQLLNIYSFAIGGAAVLAPFRALLRGGAFEHGEPVQGETEPTGEH